MVLFIDWAPRLIRFMPYARSRSAFSDVMVPGFPSMVHSLSLPVLMLSLIVFSSSSSRFGGSSDGVPPPK